jgi:hypothetical protein
MRRRLNRLPAVRVLWILATVSVVAVLAAIVMTAVHLKSESAETQRADAQKAAETSIEKLLSYDFRTVDGLSDRYRSLVTGDFAAEYKKLVEERLAPSVKAGKLANTTTAVVSGVQASKRDGALDVVLLLYLVYGKVGVGDPSSSGSRVHVTVKYEGGRWKISDVERI